jgi:hypothetical protein
MHSVCNLCVQYLHDPQPQTVALLKSCLAFVTRLFPAPAVKEAIVSIPLETTIATFSLGPTEPPLFSPGGPFDLEAVSFFYLVLLLRPDFVAAIAENGFSNFFIINLLQAAKTAFEVTGFSYLHSVIIGAILMILYDARAAEALSAPAPNLFDASVQPPNGSHADLLIGTLFWVYRKPQFCPSVVCIFHLIAPCVSFFRTGTAAKVVQFFAALVAGKSPLAVTMLEAFAGLLQRRDNGLNGFLAVLLERRRWLLSLGFGEGKGAKAFAVVESFLKGGKSALKGLNGAEVSQAEITAVLATVEVAEEQRVTLARKQHLFGGEMEKTWRKWADLLFVRSCKGEVEKMREFQREYEETLMANLGIEGSK